MFFPFNKTAHLVRGHRGTTTAIAGVSIVAVGAALYLSPAGPRDTSAPRQKVRAVTQQVWPSPSPQQRKAAPRPVKRVLTDVVRPPARTNLVVVKLPNHQTVTESIPVTGPAVPHCWNFKWQQDAQAAYLANLSDPGGLDSEPGPNNGDGIACNQLPVDPSRPRSMPSDGAVTQAVTVPSKAQLLKPAQKYYGVANNELPGNTVSFDRFDKAVGKAPSLVEWFDTWDHPYDLNGHKVQDAWDRGALPVLTWMPEAKGGNTKDQSAYKLSNIAAGNWDNYLALWAAQVVQTGLPMVVRFAHEMNGNWYPWSATSHGNTKADYLAAWRHVWNVFEAAGANKYVIWAWTPVRDTKNSGYPRYSALYPGDKYVDWIGMSGYSYGSTGPTSYDATYSYTFNELKALSSKPIFVAETGAAEAVTMPGASGTKTFASKIDYAAKRANWATQTLASFRTDSQLVGFALFDNYVANVHKVTDPTTGTSHLT
ncbi:MAG: mannan endo,4-beta-mannosidase, partial [Mycobacterium sp.]|nr:mannan endo,4-beta-mannosidase [Mycobacterium sp.]